MVSSVVCHSPGCWLCLSWPFNMAEVHSPSLPAMLITPAPGTQHVYVAIKQVVALCSQTPLSAGPLERARVCAAIIQSLWKNAATKKLCLTVLLCLEFLPKISQVLCGCSCPMLMCHLQADTELVFLEDSTKEKTIWEVLRDLDRFVSTDLLFVYDKTIRKRRGKQFKLLNKISPPYHIFSIAFPIYFICFHRKNISG